MWAAAVALALTVAACAPSGFRYVEVGSDDVVFKVPDGWDVRVLDDGSTPEPTDRLPPLGSGRPGPRIWTVALDGDPAPDPGHLETPERLDHPAGFATVMELTFEQSQQISLSDIRFSPFTEIGDPVFEAFSNDQLELVSFDEIVRDDGVRGSRFVYNVLRDPPVTVGQIALVDNANRHLYRLTLYCRSTCFREHKDLIDEIMDSWTVKEP